MRSRDDERQLARQRPGLFARALLCLEWRRARRTRKSFPAPTSPRFPVFRPFARRVGAKWRVRARCRHDGGSPRRRLARIPRRSPRARRRERQDRCPRPRSAEPLASEGPTRTPTPPFSVKFTALPARLTSTCRNARGVADDAPRRVSGDETGDLQMPSPGRAAPAVRPRSRRAAPARRARRAVRACRPRSWKNPEYRR